MESLLVKEYMNHYPVTFTPEMVIEEAALRFLKTKHSVIELGQQMLKNKPKVYPVVDDREHLVGTISRNDVLRAIDLHLRSGYKS